MANRIAGITVEIGGDTTKLSTALKSVNSEMDARRIQKNIKADERTRNINKNIAEYRAKRGETEKFPKRTIDCY